MVGFIDTDGKLINGDDYHVDLHYGLERKLNISYHKKAVKDHNGIRINDGSRPKYEFEVIAELPPNEISAEQYITLTEGLDKISARKDFITIEIDVKYEPHVDDLSKTKANFCNRYYFKDTLVDDIIKDIKNYYTKTKYF